MTEKKIIDAWGEFAGIFYLPILFGCFLWGCR
jgi:hypothetical protein